MRNQPKWLEIIERAPLFFDKLLLSKNLHGKRLASNSKEYSMFVYAKFRQIAPTKSRGVKHFLTCLREVEAHAPAALPTAVVATSS